MWGKCVVIVGLAIVAPCIGGDAWGANFQIDALPTAAFDPVTFAPIPLTLDSSGNLVGNRSMVVQVDIDVFSSGYNAAHDERGFGAMTFSLDLFGSFSNTTRPGWKPNNPLVGTSALDDLSPRWDDNSDAGKQGDLKYILLSNPVLSNPDPLDPRPSLTNGAPVKVGSVFVDWDGLGSGGIRISPDQVAYAQNSDGKLQMFQAGEYTMVGGTFHTPGWQPHPPPLPPAPVASPPPAPVVSPPPVSSPPAGSAPLASTPVVSSPIASSPAAPPITSPADPAPAVPPPGQTPSTAIPTTSTEQSTVDPPSNANSPLLPAPAIMVWRPDWERLTTIQFPLTTGIDAATLIGDGKLQLAELNGTALLFNSATAATFSDSVPEPSAVVLAAIGVLAGLPLLKNLKVASTQVCR
jgi:hypothetical protein